MNKNKETNKRIRIFALTIFGYTITICRWPLVLKQTKFSLPGACFNHLPLIFFFFSVQCYAQTKHKNSFIILLSVQVTLTTCRKPRRHILQYRYYWYTTGWKSFWRHFWHFISLITVHEIFLKQSKTQIEKKPISWNPLYSFRKWHVFHSRPIPNKVSEDFHQNSKVNKHT